MEEVLEKLREQKERERLLEGILKRKGRWSGHLSMIMR